jgi:transposase-like protein
MISEVKKCNNCQSTNIVLNGKNASGQQRYKCKDCNVTRVLNPKQKSKLIDTEIVCKAYRERNSSRSIARIFNISHTTVQNWLKKSKSVT